MPDTYRQEIIAKFYIGSSLVKLMRRDGQVEMNGAQGVDQVDDTVGELFQGFKIAKIWPFQGQK
jgi:hypothetical protein